MKKRTIGLLTLVATCNLLISSQAFSLDEEYLNNPDLLKKITINGQQGRVLVKDLRDTIKSGNATTCRQEQKSVIPYQEWDRIEAVLKEKYGLHDKDAQKKIVAARGDSFRPEKNEVRFYYRDIKAPEGKINTTFTLYGHGAKFENHGVETRVRMRTRFYLNCRKVAEGDANNPYDREDCSRAGDTANMGHLEIKIKHPSPDKENGVNKYRILLDDKNLIKLYNVDPTNEAEFNKTIEELKKAALEINMKDVSKIKDEKKKKAAEKENIEIPVRVERMFETYKMMAKKNPRFIQPQYAISYERTGYGIEETAYPMKQAGKKKKGIMAKVLRTGKKANKNSDAKDESTKTLEYQITVDKNVLAHLPMIPKTGDKLPIADHFKAENKTVYARYPVPARVVEFKDPAEISNYGKASRSTTHNLIYDELIDAMENKKMDGFTNNRGKAGHFNQFLKHNPAVKVEAVKRN
jgi:hypothetical protein